MSFVDRFSAHGNDPGNHTKKTPANITVVDVADKVPAVVSIPTRQNVVGSITTLLHRIDQR
jgi:hypothetical protein